jgi:hypothetical protein
VNKKDLRSRYWRKSDSLPEGDLHHHKGCEFFNIHICTCGLMLDMSQLKADPASVLVRYPAMLKWHSGAIACAQKFFGDSKLPPPPPDRCGHGFLNCNACGY